MTEDANESVYKTGIYWLEGDDPKMVAAIMEAQRTFGQYQEELQRETHRAVPALEDHGVKVFFPCPDDPKAGEHMWVDEVKFRDKDMQATLQNEPGWLPDLSEGDRVSFTADRVSDWFFIIDGVVHGGFTIEVVVRRLSPEQMALYRDELPMCYFVDRHAKRLATRKKR